MPSPSSDPPPPRPLPVIDLAQLLGPNFRSPAERLEGSSQSIQQAEDTTRARQNVAKSSSCSSENVGGQLAHPGMPLRNDTAKKQSAESKESSEQSSSSSATKSHGMIEAFNKKGRAVIDRLPRRTQAKRHRASSLDENDNYEEVNSWSRREIVQVSFAETNSPALRQESRRSKKRRREVTLLEASADQMQNVEPLPFRSEIHERMIVTPAAKRACQSLSFETRHDGMENEDHGCLHHATPLEEFSGHSEQHEAVSSYYPHVRDSDIHEQGSYPPAQMHPCYPPAETMPANYPPTQMHGSYPPAQIHVSTHYPPAPIYGSYPPPAHIRVHHGSYPPAQVHVNYLPIHSAAPMYPNYPSVQMYASYPPEPCYQNPSPCNTTPPHENECPRPTRAWCRECAQQFDVSRYPQRTICSSCCDFKGGSNTI